MRSESGSGSSRLDSVEKLGVGLLFSEAIAGFCSEESDAFDFLEVIPDTLWTDVSLESRPTYRDNRVALAELDAHRNAGVPIVLHSTGLSIGSALEFDKTHADHIARWAARFECPWHSDHLATFRTENPDGTLIDVGFPMPIPYDRFSLEYVSDHIRQMQGVVPVPFLLENNVYYFEIPEQELSEPEFLNALCANTGSGLLLDLHNLYTNAKNHGISAERFLERLDLEHVLEIHIAGGHELDGVWLDSHSGACPEPVWDLLTGVLASARNLAGVVFEVFPTWYSRLGSEGLRRELERARKAWSDSGRSLS